MMMIQKWSYNGRHNTILAIYHYHPQCRWVVMHNIHHHHYHQHHNETTRNNRSYIPNALYSIRNIRNNHHHNIVLVMLQPPVGKSWHLWIPPKSMYPMITQITQHHHHHQERPAARPPTTTMHRFMRPMRTIIRSVLVFYYPQAIIDEIHPYLPYRKLSWIQRIPPTTPTPWPRLTVAV